MAGMRRLLICLLLGALGFSATAARGSARVPSPHARHAPKAARTPKTKAPQIKRSAKAKDEFQRAHPCPSTGRTSGGCRGYVVDHVNPLACGGADAPGNMEWQTAAAAKAKDKVERAGCHR
jgi:hypothetical protein